MKLDRRVAALEGRLAPKQKHHVILVHEPGHLSDPDSEWDVRNEAALDAYGRERVGPDDGVLYVQFMGRE